MSEILELEDGRLAIAELDDWDRPTVRIVTKSAYGFEQMGLRERARVERLSADAYRKRSAELHARIKRNVSPEAYEVWKYRHSFTYILKKVWTAEKVQEMWHAPSPLMNLLDES